MLDPTLLEQSILDRMPQPTGWRILVLPYAGKAKTKGGIILANETVNREALATVVAYVVKNGSTMLQRQSKIRRNPLV